VALGYWQLGFRNQNRFLLAASYLFYGWWDWRFLLLMMGSTLIDYFIAIKISEAKDPRLRRSLLVLSLVVNFSILGFFKYFNFFADSLGHVLAGVGIKASLPVLSSSCPLESRSTRFRRWPTSLTFIRGNCPLLDRFWTMACSSACSRT
jgi:alginate O-acetyltransferase complex protein AlgI